MALPIDGPLPEQPRRGKPEAAPEDTIEGCEDRASADLARAAEMDTRNGRAGMERSARSWTDRAELLREERDSSAAHRAHLRAEWEAGEKPISRA
jgi:hypothetical protein